jgi:hypothetical protein
MTTFTYTVILEVEDDLGMATECYDPDYFDQCDTDYDEEGNVTARWLLPEAKAGIIMASRLGVDEDLGTAIGNYRIDYEVVLG